MYVKLTEYTEILTWMISLPDKQQLKIGGDLMITILDYMIILVYMGVLIFIGVKSSGKVEDEKDFLIAGGRLGYQLYVPALAAVMIGGGVTFGTVGLGYQYGISGMWLGIMFGVGFFAFGILLPNKLSKLKAFSVVETLGNKYGNSSRFFSGWIMIVYDLMIAVNAIIGTGVMIALLFDVNLSQGILIGGVIVAFYTLLGGMWAVTLTDVVQFWLLMFGIIVLLVPLSISHVGGISAVTSQVDTSFFNITNIGIKQIFSFFLLYVFGVMVGQDVWQRAFTAKDKRIMQKGSFLAGGACIIYAIACAIIGLTASIILPSLDNPQDAISQLITTILPTGLSGLIIAAILAALMSSGSGTLLASSTVAVNDFLIPLSKLLFKKEYSAKQIVLLSRVATLIFSIIAILIAIYLKSILAALDVAYALLSGGVFLPVMAALFWKKVTAKIAFSSMMVSSIVVIVDLIIEGVSSLNSIIYGIIAGGIVMLTGVFISKSTKIDKENYDKVM